MQFYRIDMNLCSCDAMYNKNLPTPEERDTRREKLEAINETVANYSEKISNNGFFFMSSHQRNRFVFGMVIRKPMDVDDYINSFLNETKITVPDNVRVKETLMEDFGSMLDCAERNEFVYDETEVLERFELDNLIGGYSHRHMRGTYDERIIHVQDKAETYACAGDYYAQKTLIPELDRIFVDIKPQRSYGHPVHYMVEADDVMTRKGVSRLLIQSLNAVGRINNLRYCEFGIEPDMSFDSRWTDAIYKTCIGGAVILNFNDTSGEEETDVVKGYLVFLEDLCKIIKRHCRDVLTIICLPKEGTRLKQNIFENVGNCSFVEIKEEFATYDEAIEYLKNSAAELHIRTDKALFSGIEKGQLYQIKELKQFFDEWYSIKLKSTIYKQYQCIAGAKSLVKDEEPKGSAYDELMSMIGLKSAKYIINQALDSYKAQKIFKDKGMLDAPFCNHMIFTGNPGTAKTSVARLFAKIMKENDVISRGHIVEVGRGDLVGKYVGWTAPTIKRKFKEALGGILFIDEAYSLVDDRSGSFGDEAINTIVQEMENHRDEVIVIFAGYPDKMEEFLNKNPGLRSRIAHHVHFEDYGTEELCQIANFIASKNGLILSEDANEKIEKIMDQARKDSDFGNGRYARNLIEKARMAQNSRLVHMDYEKVTSQDIKLIKAEDVEIPILETKKSSSKIGFSIA